MGRKERKPRESAPYVPDFGTQGTGAAHGGHRSRRGRGPRMAWPPSAVLEGGAHKRSAVGRIAPKGRTSRGPLPAGDSPTCETAPFRPLPAGDSQPPGTTCGRTKWAEIVLRRERAPRRHKKNRPGVRSGLWIPRPRAGAGGVKSHEVGWRQPEGRHA